MAKYTANLLIGKKSRLNKKNKISSSCLGIALKKMFKSTLIINTIIKNLNFLTKSLIEIFANRATEIINKSIKLSSIKLFTKNIINVIKKRKRNFEIGFSL